MTTPEALHSSANSRWITPAPIIEAARQVMGSISCDPASEKSANEIIKASVYFTEQNSGLDIANQWFGNVWLNPPSDKRGMLTKSFYARLINSYSENLITQACYLAFSLNQLATLQDIYPPTKFPFVIFRQRIQFIDARTNEVGSQPAHHSALIYLPPKVRQPNNDSVDKFEGIFRKFGAITIPELQMEESVKVKDALQAYFDKLFEQLDFHVDEYDDDRIVTFIMNELPEMAKYVSKHVAKRNGYNV